jgi:rubrerythrin
MIRLAGVMLVAFASAMGAIAAMADQDALRDAVFAALDDERRAIATYERTIETHGERPPFANIVRAERRHEAMLLELCAERGFDPPPDRWAGAPIAVPERFDDACDAGAAAEIENVAMYDRLLEAAAGDERVRTLFERLRAASQERHLPAFRRHGGGWDLVAPGDLTDAQRAQVADADAAREAMFQRLLATLTDEIQRVGVAGAIGVCQTEAPRIAQAVGEERGVAIGRTSWRLRNPENTPPAWAVGLLQDRPDSARQVVADDGRVGVLHPIFIMPACVQCHGEPNDLAPGVAAALAQRYPEDEATGFSAGDLRGWFWVQVPAR